jgi:hypothetical protein
MITMGERIKISSQDEISYRGTQCIETRVADYQRFKILDDRYTTKEETIYASDQIKWL